ncbi:MAG TPA: heme-binding protein [Burkholderiaceae bacterium]|nr:heme-binding protein [Burkholderiaceae bacterium]
MNKFMLATLLPFVSTLAVAQTGSYSTRVLTPETALKATLAALEDCRKRGAQVAVAVVDRSGVAQVMMRDRFAGPHTVSTAINKGYTATSFRIDTLELAKQTQSGSPSSGVRALPNVVAVGGGVLIQAGGATLAAIGVSGAPGGEVDDACAKAGIAAIRDEIDF